MKPLHREIVNGLPTDESYGRYTYEAVILELQILLKKKGHGSKKLAAATADLLPTQFSKRLRGSPERFTIEQLGRIADWAKAPPGWPFIPWEHAEDMRRAWRDAKSTGTRKK
jgi:hypothetical protein